MKRIIIVLIIGLVHWMSCTPKISHTFITSIDDFVIERSPAKFQFDNDPLNFIPDSSSKMKYIRVNVHFMDDSTGTKNFSLLEGKTFMDALLDNANKRLGLNKKMNLPLNNETAVVQINYRYKVVPASNDPNDNGYYKHFDNELYYFLNKGIHRNNYDREVIKKYNIGADSIVNIFILPHHPDSVKSGTYKPHRTGIALGTDLKVSGLFEHPEEPWKFATLLNHEVGHILGLSHSWVRNDRCEDTPVHPNCWDQQSPPPCDGNPSNNMMDYNNSQMALTPCQLGIINKGFYNLNHKNRKLIEVDWCHLEDTSEIIIKDSIQWLGSKDIQRSIRVRSGAIFEIYNRISMAEGSKIIVEPGATLRLYDSYLHNDCGLNWNGIEVQNKGQQKGSVEAFGNVRIENVKQTSNN